MLLTSKPQTDPTNMKVDFLNSQLFLNFDKILESSKQLQSYLDSAIEL